MRNFAELKTEAEQLFDAKVVPMSPALHSPKLHAVLQDPNIQPLIWGGKETRIPPVGGISLFGDVQQILAVIVLGHGLGQFSELLLVDPSAFVGDFLDTGHLQTLALLNHFDEGRCFRE